MKQCKKCGSWFEGRRCSVCEQKKIEIEEQKRQARGKAQADESARSRRWSEMQREEREKTRPPETGILLLISWFALILGTVLAAFTIFPETTPAGIFFGMIYFFSGVISFAVCGGLGRIVEATWTTAYHSRRAADSLERMERGS